MKNLNEVIREKEEQVRLLMEQIDKLRAAAQILEEERDSLGVEPVVPASSKAADNTPAVKRAWP